MFHKHFNRKIKTHSIVVATTLSPIEFATVLTFVASQTLDIVSTIQVLRLVTIVFMIKNDFNGTQ